MEAKEEASVNEAKVKVQKATNEPTIAAFKIEDV